MPYKKTETLNHDGFYKIAVKVSEKAWRQANKSAQRRDIPMGQQLSKFIDFATEVDESLWDDKDFDSYGEEK